MIGQALLTAAADYLPPDQWQALVMLMRTARQVAYDEGLPRRPSVLALRKLFEEVGDG